MAIQLELPLQKNGFPLPSPALVTDWAFSDVAYLEERVDTQLKTIFRQAEEIDKLKKDVDTLVEGNNELAGQVVSLESDNEALKERDVNQRKALSEMNAKHTELKRQTEHLHNRIRELKREAGR